MHTTAGEIPKNGKERTEEGYRSRRTPKLLFYNNITVKLVTPGPLHVVRLKTIEGNLRAHALTSDAFASRHIVQTPSRDHLLFPVRPLVRVLNAFVLRVISNSLCWLLPAQHPQVHKIKLVIIRFLGSAHRTALPTMSISVHFHRAWEQRRILMPLGHHRDRE